MLDELKKLDPKRFGGITQRHLIMLRGRYGNPIITTAFHDLLAKEKGRETWAESIREANVQQLAFDVSTRDIGSDPPRRDPGQRL